ncbi:MAG: hypothetical protein AVDCRST_MAG55-1335, partial [uncultured Rubrobacteraceae bacterium]
DHRRAEQGPDAQGLRGDVQPGRPLGGRRARGRPRGGPPGGAGDGLRRAPQGRRQEDAGGVPRPALRGAPRAGRGGHGRRPLDDDGHPRGPLRDRAVRGHSADRPPGRGPPHALLPLGRRQEHGPVAHHGHARLNAAAGDESSANGHASL